MAARRGPPGERGRRGCPRLSAQPGQRRGAAGQALPAGTRPPPAACAPAGDQGSLPSLPHGAEGRAGGREGLAAGPGPGPGPGPGWGRLPLTASGGERPASPTCSAKRCRFHFSGTTRKARPLPSCRSTNLRSSSAHAQEQAAPTLRSIIFTR